MALCLLPDPYWFDGAAHAARSGTNKSNGRLMFRGITNVSALEPNSLVVLGKPLFRSVIELCRPTVSVAGDALSGFKGAVIFQKIRDSRRPERMRRIVCR